MHKQVPSKASRLAWIKRRARGFCLMFGCDLRTAVAEATYDWFRFNGKPLQREALILQRGGKL